MTVFVAAEGTILLGAIGQPKENLMGSYFL